MTDEMVHEKLAAEIEVLVSLKAGTIGADSDLTVLGIDSLRFVSLLLVIEEKFGVSLMTVGLTDEDTKSVRNLTKVIQAGRAA